MNTRNTSSLASMDLVETNKRRFSDPLTPRKRAAITKAQGYLSGKYDVAAVLPASKGPSYIEKQHPATHYFGYEHNQKVYESQKGLYARRSNWTYQLGDIFDFPKHIDTYAGSKSKVLFVPDLQCIFNNCDFKLINLYAKLSSSDINYLDVFLTHCSRTGRYAQNQDFNEWFKVYKIEKLLKSYNWSCLGKVLSLRYSDGAPMHSLILRARHLNSTSYKK